MWIDLEFDGCFDIRAKIAMVSFDPRARTWSPPWHQGPWLPDNSNCHLLIWSASAKSLSLIKPARSDINTLCLNHFSHSLPMPGKCQWCEWGREIRVTQGINLDMYASLWMLMFRPVASGDWHQTMRWSHLSTTFNTDSSDRPLTQTPLLFSVV